MAKILRFERPVSAEEIIRREEFKTEFSLAAGAALSSYGIVGLFAAAVGGNASPQQNLYTAAAAVALVVGNWLYSNNLITYDDTLPDLRT